MISIDQHARLDGIIPRALREVGKLFDDWASSAGNEQANDALGGWSGVDLGERLAMALLRERGYDEELLEMAQIGEPPEGWTLGDLDAELERTRFRYPERP